MCHLISKTSLVTKSTYYTNSVMYKTDIPTVDTVMIGFVARVGKLLSANSVYILTNMLINTR